MLKYALSLSVLGFGCVFFSGCEMLQPDPPPPAVVIPIATPTAMAPARVPAKVMIPEQ